LKFLNFLPQGKPWHCRSKALMHQREVGKRFGRQPKRTRRNEAFTLDGSIHPPVIPGREANPESRDSGFACGAPE
jgi:hypothetical protein